MNTQHLWSRTRVASSPRRRGICTSPRWSPQMSETTPAWWPTPSQRPESRVHPLLWCSAVMVSPEQHELLWWKYYLPQYIGLMVRLGNTLYDSVLESDRFFSFVMCRLSCRDQGVRSDAVAGWISHLVGNYQALAQLECCHITIPRPSASFSLMC